MEQPVATLTPELAEQIVRRFAGGNSRVQAAALCGVPRTIFARWRRRGDKELSTWDGESTLSVYGLMMWGFERADAEYHEEMICEGMFRSDRFGIRDRQWLAERRWRPQYASTQEVGVDHDDDDSGETVEQSMRDKIGQLLGEDFDDGG